MVAGVSSPLRLTDIASQAQVSEATVSRVLNGKAGVGGGGGGGARGGARRGGGGGGGGSGRGRGLFAAGAATRPHRS
ncbi:LacI family DNA-binding transcriptional regulator, partial [Streptomyces sp. NPDC127110]|uniref:LacI family DNA-binding transcriptional regulator n=1 Tax=Streptomyces sp. NPDC127110 TaxID=3345362 RepID=UPI003626D106